MLVEISFAVRVPVETVRVDKSSGAAPDPTAKPLIDETQRSVVETLNDVMDETQRSVVLTLNAVMDDV